MKPSDYLRRQLRVPLVNDAIGPLTLPYRGYDLLLWGAFRKVKPPEEA